MKITFKTLQQKTFQIEIEETETVKVLKEKIHTERGDEFPIEGQKLIYAGKILEDDKEIKEYKIDYEKNFVVVMAVKAKKPATDKPADTSSSSATPAPTTTPATTTATPAPTTAPASETTTAPASDTTARTTESAESALLTGSALESSINELMSLGYTREQVMRALNASFHNADRAAEYLLSGNIPDIGGDDVDPTGEEGGQEGGDISGMAASGDLSFLNSSPQFQLMRQQIRQNPGSLPQLLQEIGQANPQLLSLINENQQAFIDLLNSDDPAPGLGGGVGGGAPPAGGVPGGGFQIPVTTEEKACIDRIVAMGFPENEVIQAFFACDKNEQLTINFLLG